MFPVVGLALISAVKDDSNSSDANKSDSCDEDGNEDTTLSASNGFIGSL